MSNEKLTRMIEEAKKVSETVDQEYKDVVFNAYLTKLILSEGEQIPKEKKKSVISEPEPKQVSSKFQLSSSQISELKKSLTSFGKLSGKEAGLVVACFLYEMGIKEFSRETLAKCYKTMKMAGVQNIPAVQKPKQLVTDIKTKKSWFDLVGDMYKVSMLGFHQFNEMKGALKDESK